MKTKPKRVYKVKAWAIYNPDDGENGIDGIWDEDTNTFSRMIYLNRKDARKVQKYSGCEWEIIVPVLITLLPKKKPKRSKIK